MRAIHKKHAEIYHEHIIIWFLVFHLNGNTGIILQQDDNTKTAAPSVIRMTLTRFINVDLDIRAKAGIQALLKAFGPAVVNLKREEENCLSLEILDQPQSIDEAISSFCALVSSLPPEIRAIWNKCEVRSLNIGIQSGTASYSESFLISGDTISLVSSINAEVIITVYSEKP